MGAPATKRFAIRRKLGEGGMGVVYEAFDEDRHAAVALKTLNRFDGGALARFKREFRALQGIAHPNLVALDELFFDDEQWFFTMELLDGVDLVTHVRGVAPQIDYQSTVRESARSLAARPAPAPGEQGAVGAFDETRLRASLKQLLQGLEALHAADKVHRDIKPSNVLVTREGRVVLLDFGLVVEASADDHATGSAVVGTPVYMAPEQAASREVGPAADLYAVGVLLYELLTGKVPIDGPPLQVLLEKQTREPASPASVSPGVPDDLDELCLKLLRFAPADRPTATGALRLLAASRSLAPAAPRSSEAPAFVGRRAELEVLRVAFRKTCAGELAAVLVCGESGIGKSHMVHRFTELLLEDQPDAMVLEGRCYEREAVPYKALDGIVDALSSRLSRMKGDEVAALLPARSAVLGQVFPAMLRVREVARAHASLVSDTEPHELRRRAFLALRDLLVRLANRRATVVVIDDLQWADDDGLRALAEILQPPEAPGLLLVGTVRASPGAADAGLERLRAALPGDKRVMELARLAPDEARELAVTLLRRADASADPDLVAGEARGHPLFLEELTRHVALGGSARDDVKLDDAIWARVAQLDPATRELAELVVVAGKPLAQAVVAAAAGTPSVAFNRRVAVLRAVNIVRTAGARWVDAIEPYHDRVREAVLAHLDPARRRALHEAIANALQATSSDDAEMLAVHWREAGNASHASRYAAMAGDQAARTFAFDRAAQCYDQALTLLPAGHAGAARRELRIKLGDALAYAGRGALAAPQFEAAATESPPVQAIELRRRAADQLLRTGHFDRGVEAARGVLAAIGMRMPATRFGTLAMLVWWRLLLLLRGVRFAERESGQFTAEELMRIDVCWSVGMALTFADSFVGNAFMTRALVLALRAGERERITRCVGIHVGFSSWAGVKYWPRTQRLITYTRELALRSGTLQARFFAIAPAGVAHYCNGYFREAARLLDEALEMTADGSTGLVHERVTARFFLVTSLAYLGRFKDMRRIQLEGLRDALARGDVYAMVNLRLGLPNMVWLVEDRPDLAESNADAATREWSQRGFHLEHFYALLSSIATKLYTGDVEAAYALGATVLDRTRRSLLWRIQITRLRAIQLHAAAVLAKLATLAPGAREHRGLVEEAARDARAIEREGAPWALPGATLVRAGIALRSGARADAISALEKAARDFDAVNMVAMAAATRDRLARLRGGASADEDVARTAALLRAEEVANPERFVEMLVPGMRE